MSSSQRVPLSSGSGGPAYKASAASGAALQTAPPPVVTTPFAELQVLASTTAVFNLDVPAVFAGAFADVPFSFPLGLPSFTLTPKAAGLIMASLELTVQPSGLFVSISKQVRYSGIVASNAWNLSPGASFAGGQVVGVLRAFSPGGASAQSVSLLCSALAFAIPQAGV